jgi:hypothetical protein
MMLPNDFPLVRGGKIPKEALPWLAEVERVFPGATKDIIIVRNTPALLYCARRRREGTPIAQESKIK